jgi:hypothetical protein
LSWHAFAASSFFEYSFGCKTRHRFVTKTR